MNYIKQISSRLQHADLTKTTPFVSGWVTMLLQHHKTTDKYTKAMHMSQETYDVS